MRLLKTVFLCLLLSSSLALAQGWPSKPVRFVVPFPPGGSTDVAARSLADKLSQSLGQQVVVENRGGAGGALGTGEVARAAPDGYTFLFAANAVSILHLAVKDLPYDMLRDFVPVTQVTTQPNAVAVNASLPVNDIKGLIAHARANKVAYAHAGNGGGQHLSGELLKRMGGFDMLGVPYRGGGQAITDLLGNQVQVAVLGSTPLMPHHKSGKIRILAFTSMERFSGMPEIPTLHELGFKGFDATQWLGLLAPKGTPAEAIKRLQEETARALKLPDVQARLAGAALQPVGSTPEQFGALIKAEIESFGKLARELGIQPQ
jgi:tripartite-type tricarboxylate transporter receptor subunit TctC